MRKYIALALLFFIAPTSYAWTIQTLPDGAGPGQTEVKLLPGETGTTNVIVAAEILEVLPVTVSLSIKSGLPPPSESGGSLSRNSCVLTVSNPTCTSVLTITTSSSTPEGNYPVVVEGSSGGA